jgi:hypothetical protein
MLGCLSAIFMPIALANITIITFGTMFCSLWHSLNDASTVGVSFRISAWCGLLAVCIAQASGQL